MFFDFTYLTVNDIAAVKSITGTRLSEKLSAVIAVFSNSFLGILRTKESTRNGPTV